SAVYTVEQNVTKDVATTSSTALNHVFFDKYDNMTLADKQKAWREFYYRWIIPPNGQYLSQIPDQLPDEAMAVTIDETHWRLLEANVALGLKLFAQGVEMAVDTPINGTTLWSLPTNFSFQGFVDAYNQRNAYVANMNAFESAVYSANSQSEWRNMSYTQVGTRTVYSWFGFVSDTYPVYGTNIYSALLNDTAPELPETIDFSTLAGIAPTTNMYAGSRQLDKVLYQEYLRPIVAYSIWGDFIRSDQMRLGTGLTDQRIGNWGYEPDFYGSDLVYTNEVPVGGGTLAHISGESGVWAPDSFYNQADPGARMFWDLVSLFYDVSAPKDVAINVVQNFVGQTQRDSASYRFDDLAQRTATKILPANYDLTKIAGVVRVAGGAGNDTVEINAKPAAGTEVTVAKQTLQLADYTFNIAALATLPSGVTHEDVQDALVRADKETDIGVLERLLTNTTSSTVVHVTVDETKYVNVLDDWVNAVATKTNDLQAITGLSAAQAGFADLVDGFALRGQQILGITAGTSTSTFSLDKLNELLDNATLAAMLTSSNTAIQA